MCGIAGIFGLGGAAKEAVVQMTAALAHRGPDDQGVFADEHIALGHRRLSILDPSSAGRQPMATDDANICVVFNGEIYNFRDLRSLLLARGHRFKTGTDTEVLLVGYREWGDKVVERLNGDFAFAIYDSQKRRLVLGRDRFGVKPLYYARTDDGALIFASEVRSILASGLVAPRLNEARISEFLALQSVSPPETLISGIRMLEAGTLMRVEADCCQYWTYWDLADSASEPLQESEDVIRDGIRERLYKATERQMVSDVPLGAFLSGGIDSSAVVGMMSRLVDSPIQTLGVSFPDEGFDDGHYARRAARAFGTEHTEVTLTDEELLDYTEAALLAQDHPSADGVNTYVVSAAAKSQGLTVALSGLGGDELFAGYSNFKRMALLNKLSRGWNLLPRAARSAMADRAGGAHRSIALQKAAALLRSDGSVAEVYPILRQVLSDAHIRGLLRHPSDSGQRATSRLRAVFRGRHSIPLLSKLSYAEATTYMHDVLLRDTDQMSMAHGLEVRVPLLDADLAEYVVRVPDRMKTSNNIPKVLLVEALDGLIPEEIVCRPKQGFQMPFARWMRGPLRQMCTESLTRLAQLSLFDEAAVMGLWSDFLDDESSVSWSRIWLLHCVGSWISNILQPAPDAHSLPSAHLRL